MHRYIIVLFFLFASITNFSAEIEVQKDPEKNNSQDAPSLKVNVSGRKLTLPPSLFIKYESALSFLVAGKMKSKLDDDGYIYLDADPELFEKYVVNWLRHDYVAFASMTDAINTYQLCDYLQLVDFQIYITFWIHTKYEVHERKRAMQWIAKHPYPQVLPPTKLIGDVGYRLEFQGNQLYYLDEKASYKIGSPLLRPSAAAFKNIIKEYNRRTQNKQLVFAPDASDGVRVYNIQTGKFIGYEHPGHGKLTAYPYHLSDHLKSCSLLNHVRGNYICTFNQLELYSIYDINTGTLAHPQLYKHRKACLKDLDLMMSDG